ncbi:MAG: BatD family protein [Mariprofundaceae bacterium]|nr:BatD family protein [Mariprofundaceae bacterium]
MVKQGYLGLCVLFGLCFPQLAWAESAIASLDRSTTSIQESVQLTIHVEGSADQDPDFSPLKRDFEVLAQSQNSNYSFINGHMNRSKDWNVTLMPKHTGSLSIPAISLGNMMTNALMLKVVAVSSQVQQTQQQNVFLSMSANVLDSYVQAQILVTVKLFRAVSLLQAELSEPEAKHVIIKRLGKDKNYETLLNQRRYVVTERNYALFPQQSGRLHIPAVVMHGQINQGRGMFNQAGRVIRVHSKDIDVNVQPMPHSWDVQLPWLPASDVSLREIPNSQHDLHVGDSFTRTIEMRVHGLTAEQLPPLISQDVAKGWKQYPDKPELKTEVDEHGVVGIRREKIALVPTQAGDLKLPAIRVAWWNTDTHQVEHAEVLSRMVTVKANTAAQKSTPAPASQSKSTPPLISSTGITGSTTQAVVDHHHVKIWQGISAALLMAWLLTLVWIWYGKQHAASQKEQHERDHARTLKSARKALERACRESDAQHASQALLIWGEVMFQRHDLKHFSQLKWQFDNLDEALDDLQRYLYRDNHEKTWDGMKLWNIVANLSVPVLKPVKEPLKAL